MSKKYFKAKIILLFIPLYLIIGTDFFANENNLPWKKDNILTDSRKITDIQTHPEFIRLYLERLNEKTVIEVTYNNGMTNGVATKYYIIQPAPGSTFNKELIDYIKEQLSQLENRVNHVPLVSKQPSVNKSKESNARQAILFIKKRSTEFLLIFLILVFYIINYVKLAFFII